mmetsp:Transcript_136887/g.237864  ORF Transcript_136887/g.237864 Transcript_136887/m.237864 type:complete len:205 (+) Transcript_136887:591-1205(+)
MASADLMAVPLNGSFGWLHLGGRHGGRRDLQLSILAAGAVGSVSRWASSIQLEICNPQRSPHVVGEEGEEVQNGDHAQQLTKRSEPDVLHKVAAHIPGLHTHGDSGGVEVQGVAFPCQRDGHYNAEKEGAYEGDQVEKQRWDEDADVEQRVPDCRPHLPPDAEGGKSRDLNTLLLEGVLEHLVLEGAQNNCCHDSCHQEDLEDD